MAANSMQKLTALGQSIWLDYIRRDLISGGGLKKLIEQDELRGITSNPAIFEKAIVDTQFYDAQIKELSAAGKSLEERYEALSQKDVRDAADQFRSVYDRTKGKDGFVSLEVNPHLANDTGGTIEEARRLWAALDRPNVFIKVPGTAAGVPAIRQLIGEGININVTLLFGLPRYHEVAEAYVAGLEHRLAQGKPIDRLASVASFFLSRIDSLIDPQLDKLAKASGGQAALAGHVRGEVAIASARVAYQMYKRTFEGARFKLLRERGGQTQRLLWASTSTKNPAYSDVKYVEALIGPDTVNTLPMETLEAYRDHGQPAARLENDVEHARWVLEQLPSLGIDIDQITQQLEDDGIVKFNQPFDKLLKRLGEKAL